MCDMSSNNWAIACCLPGAECKVELRPRICDMGHRHPKRQLNPRPHKACLHTGFWGLFLCVGNWLSRLQPATVQQQVGERLDSAAFTGFPVTTLSRSESANLHTQSHQYVSNHLVSSLWGLEKDQPNTKCSPKSYLHEYIEVWKSRVLGS